MKSSVVLAGVLLVALGLVVWWALGGAGPARVETVLPEVSTEADTRPWAVAPDSLVAERPSGASAGPARSPVEVDEPAAAADADPVMIRVATTETLGDGAAIVPNVAFELYRARPGTGTARIGLPHRADRPLASGRTDARGVAFVELAASSFERDERGQARLVVRVVEPGYRAGLGFVSPRLTELDDIDTLQVVTLPGATLRGRRVDASGQEVDAAALLMHWVDLRGTRQLMRVFTLPRKLGDGWFEIDFDSDYDDAVLVATTEEQGTGALAGLDLRLEDPPQDLRVVVSGDGRVRGRVVDGAGTPAAGVEILVWYASFDDGTGTFVAPEPLSSELETQGGGSLWKTLVTDSEGRFDVTGLRPQAYVVRARTGQGVHSGYPILLTPAPIPADGRELVLQLARSFLAVEVRDAEGEPWSASAIALRGSRSPDRELAAWPDAPTLVVVPCAPAGGEAIAQGDPLDGRLVGPCEAVFEVPDGARYLVGALGGGFRGELRAVEVLPGAGRVPVRLVAPGPSELGTVSIRVRFDGRELTGKSFDDPAFAVLLEQIDTAAVLLRTEPDEGDPPYEFRVPPGRYRAVAEGRPTLDFWHGALLRDRALGRAEAEVVVLADGRHDVVLELQSGGRVELRLEGEASDDDREAVAGWQLWLGDPETAPEALATVRLLREGRRPEPVERAITDPQSGWRHPFWGWPLGETYVSDVLPLGRYTLVARLPGGREVRAPVEIGRGTPQKVVLRF